MGKKYISCLLVGLLAINSLCVTPVKASIAGEGDNAYEEVLSGETEATEIAVTAAEIPVVEEGSQEEEVVAAEKDGQADASEEEIPIDEEHFPDAEFRRYVSGKEFDKNQDGVFSSDEISQITAISAWVEEYAVEPDFPDMRGTEYFTSLTFLAVAIAEPGVKLDFSKMPHLESLTIEASSIPTIDLSGNIQIKNLRIDSPIDSPIKQLILSEGNNIQEFYVFGNSFDFSCVRMMKKLRKLSCIGLFNEKYKDWVLDTSFCTELEELEITTKNIISLDLRNNKKLKRIEIEGCSTMKTLDLSENRELEYLDITCWEYMDNFGYIDTGNCYNSVGFIDQTGKLEKNPDGSYDMGSIQGYKPERFKAVYGAEISNGKMYPKERYVTYEYYLDNRMDKYGTFEFDFGKQINPEAVEGLTITGKTETSISCKWTASKDAHTGYVIYAKNAATGKNEKRIVLKKGTTSYKINGLKPGGRYEIIVRAYRTYGGKNYYSVYYKGTEFCYTMPAKPTLKVSTSGSKVTYTWSHKKSAYRQADSGYLLYYSTNKKGPYTRAVILPDTKKSYSVNLKKGRTYYFKMRAYVQYNKWTSPTFSKFSNVVTKKL